MSLGMLMAVTAVITPLMIALFFITQRTFIKGIARTGLTIRESLRDGCQAEGDATRDAVAQFLKKRDYVRRRGPAFAELTSVWIQDRHCRTLPVHTRPDRQHERSTPPGRLCFGYAFGIKPTVLSQPTGICASGKTAGQRKPVDAPRLTGSRRPRTATWGRR